jgi:uroporphyrinogen-III synthase
VPQRASPHVIVTRPAREAAQWVADLARRGFQASALPLIDIEPADNLPALRTVWQEAGQYAAWMFVSANAVRHFFAARVDGPAVTLPRCLATGPGTRAALLAGGVDAGRIDAPSAGAAQFDSEALWRVIGERSWRDQRVLIVRGGKRAAPGAQDESPADAGATEGRDWLALQLQAAGARVEFALAYRRGAPLFTTEQRRQMDAWAEGAAIWLFSSSEALENLPQRDWSRARAVATHARIGQAARRAGFGVVCESRPALDDVVRSIESLA